MTASSVRVQKGGHPAARTLLLFASSLTMLGLLECGARLLLPEVEVPYESQGEDFDWRAPAPYVAFQATPSADVRIAHGAWVRLQAAEGEAAHVVTDAHGFRYDADLSEPKRPGELRIFLLGGSVTLLGLSNESTLCGALERRAAERVGPGRPVRCVSAGIMTGVSDQELARLVHQVARLEPDIVISFSGFNDAIARERFDPRLGAPASWSVFELAYRGGLEAARNMRSDVAALPLWKLVLSRSRLALAIAPSLALDQLLTGEEIERVHGSYERVGPEATAAHFLENWRLMETYTEALGADFVGILQPFRPKERDAGTYGDFYQRVNVAIDAASAAGRPLYSFDRMLDDRSELFYDPVHTFDVGHELYAERVVAILAERGLLGEAR